MKNKNKKKQQQQKKTKKTAPKCRPHCGTPGLHFGALMMMMMMMVMMMLTTMTMCDRAGHGADGGVDGVAAVGGGGDADGAYKNQPHTTKKR